MHRTHTLMALALLGLNAAAAAQSWSDDFNDGSVTDDMPVSWLWDPISYPGIYDASSGDFVMAGLNPDVEEVFLAAVPIAFLNGASVRTQAVISGGAGNAGVGFGDLGTASGYLGALTQVPDLRLGRFDRGVLTTLSIHPVSVDHRKDFLVQIDVFDGVVSLRAWQAGEPMPAPQIVVPDATYPVGAAGIYFEENLPDIATGTGTFRFAQAADAVITDPCPADLDDSGGVNGFDLALLLGEWTGTASYAPCPPLAAADLDGDCRINGFDLALLLGAWGECP